ncbi:MAG: rod shape-determining protein MreD [Phycisphaerae bacterium]|nr:rod shape-determining protein MreD [Gemmatimonadaceae bacterium]
MAVRTQPSGVAASVQAVIGFALLLLAHYTVRPLLGGRAQIDFLAIAVLFSAVRVRPGSAALMGFLIGLTVDALQPDSFGAATLAFTLVGYSASWLKAVFFADHVALTGLFVFAGKWLYDGVYNLAGPRIGGLDLVLQMLLWTPLAAALTALVAVLLLTVFRPLYRPYTK